MAALTARFFAGPMQGALKWGTLGSRVPVEFGRFDDRSYQVLEFPIFMLIGVFGGLCGALFNYLNTRLSLLRMKYIGPTGHKRFLEVLVVTLSIVSFNFLAPILMGGGTEMASFSTAQRLFVDAGGE